MMYNFLLSCPLTPPLFVLISAGFERDSPACQSWSESVCVCVCEGPVANGNRRQVEGLGGGSGGGVTARSR